MENKKIVLLNRPEGLPKIEHFKLETEEAAQPGEGEILVQTEFLSIDAWIGTTLSPGWLHELMPLEGTVPAIGVGKVLASGSPDFSEGDMVAGAIGAQSHATAAAAGFQKIDTSLAPSSAFLGLLSVTTGITAYFGIKDLCDIKEGDTVVVSAAAGAVGSVAGQMAKIEGAGKVIGIAGGPQKCQFLLDEMGFDAAIDYKGEDVEARIAELAPDGVNVFFDNVGGEMLDAVLEHIAERARVCICGAISQYDDNSNVYGPKKYLRLAERYARMEGYTAFHFVDRYPEAIAEISGWMAEGKITIREQVEEGIESFPKALEMLFTGGNTGKLLVKA